MTTCYQCATPLRWWQVTVYITAGVLVHECCLADFARELFQYLGPTRRPPRREPEFAEVRQSEDPRGS